MSSSYDKYYQTENLFGEPYPELTDFFSKLKHKGKVLDFGCGQGRNAIALARMGFEVTGIDSSEVGIDQMNQVAKSEILNLLGIVADIYSYESFDKYNIILLDSMFHFNKKDKEKETGLVKKIIAKMKEGTTIIFCIQDSKKKVKILKDTIGDSVQIIEDISLNYIYEEKASEFRTEMKCKMIAAKK